MVVQRSLEVGTESRLAEVPRALTTGAYERAPYPVGLPTEVFWSGARLNLDPLRLRDRVRVGERVLTKENTDDVLHFDDPGEPIEWWPPIFDPTCLLHHCEARGRSGHRELTTLSSPQYQGTSVVANVVGARDPGLVAQHLADVRLGFNLEKS